jgi:hypothetical protein
MPAQAEDDDVARILLFSGRDLWRNGASAHGGLIWGPIGFDRDTPLLKLLLSSTAMTPTISAARR